MRDLLLAAQREKYAIGGFNVATGEEIIGVLQAMEVERSPVISQVATTHLVGSRWLSESVEIEARAQ